MEPAEKALSSRSSHKLPKLGFISLHLTVRRLVVILCSVGSAMKKSFWAISLCLLSAVLLLCAVSTANVCESGFDEIDVSAAVSHAAMPRPKATTHRSENRSVLAQFRHFDVTQFRNASAAPAELTFALPSAPRQELLCTFLI